MVDTPQWLIGTGVAIFAYMVGSVNLSVIACRLFGITDLLSHGSGNPGATNLLRVAGPGIAVPVLLLDFAKASATILVAPLLGLQDGAALLGIPLLIGNIFPVFHRFRGGKGVATTVGAFLAIAPLAMLFGSLIFVTAVLLSRRVSMGSILMVTSYPVWILVLDGPAPALITAGFAAIAIVLTHRANIARLTRGREPRFGDKSAGDR
jgi:glycerol-3-phosphate acyltransferase PlsY